MNALIMRHPNEGKIAAQGNGKAEPFIGLSIVWDKFGFLNPGFAVPTENISSTRAIRRPRSTIGPDEGEIATEGDGITKIVIGLPITCGKFGLLNPGHAIVSENVSSTGSGGCTLRSISPDEGIITADGDRMAKTESIMRGDFGYFARIHAGKNHNGQKQQKYGCKYAKFTHNASS